METRHRVVGDAREMAEVGSDEIDLMVTSPPYPMIETWDESFAARDERIGERLTADDGDGAFQLMHAQLDAVWDEVARVLAPGGSPA